MQSIETILAIGAFVLLTVFTLTLNSNIVQEEATMYQGSQLFEAIGVAQGYIEEAEFLEYDDHKSASARNSFTPHNELGPEGESYGEFDDIDDFNGFHRTDTLYNSISFNIDITVSYIQESSPFSVTTSKTYLKKLEVIVSSDDFSSTSNAQITLEKIFAFHNIFRN